MGRGRGGCAHTLPVVTGRFLFSQAPDLLLPMWKQGQLQPGWLQAGRPADRAQRGTEWACTPGPNLGRRWPELPPSPRAPSPPIPSTKRKEPGKTVTQGRAGGPEGLRSRAGSPGLSAALCR